MDVNPIGIRTSFIPKESLGTPASGGRSARKEGLGFFTFLCITVLIVSLFGWVAAYGYRSLLEKEVADLDQNLSKAKEAFEPGLLKVFENLDRRLRVAGALIDGHTSVAPFFQTMDELTLKSVRYSTLTMLSSNGSTGVKITGEALGFPSIALQALSYSKDGRIENPIFSNLGVEDNGRVSFNVSFNVDPSLMLYKQGQGSQLEGL